MCALSTRNEVLFLESFLILIFYNMQKSIITIKVFTFFNKFFAIGIPMFPRPTKPTFDFHRLLSSKHTHTDTSC